MDSAVDFSILSRRRFLKLTLGAGLFVGLGGGGLWSLRGRAPRVDGLRCLTWHEYRTVDALARGLFPAGGAFDLGAEQIDLARDFDGFLADEPEWNRSDLKRALLLFEFGPVLFNRSLTTFSHLSADARARHFEEWSTSDSELRRQVALAFRRFLSLLFYDRPEAWASIGYDGPMIRRPA